MARFQRGSLRVEPRKNGPTWVLRYFVTRPSDSRRVEHKVAVGLVRDFPSESAAWAEVEKQHLQTQINQSDFRGRVTFADFLSITCGMNWASRRKRSTRSPTQPLQGTNAF